MANVRDSDTSLWLHNKLGTSNDSWTSGSICSQLSKEVLRNIKDCFPDLQTQVKLKLLLSFFHIPRRLIEEWKCELEEIIDTAGIDSELWVSMLAENMKTLPATGSLNTEITDYEETRPIFMDMVNDLRKLVTKHSDLGMLPLECQYLNKAALTSMVGQQPAPQKHFTLKRKPKSTALRAELLQKSCDAQSTLKKVSAPTIPLRSRGMPRKMTDTTPLKGIPSRVPTSGFRSPPSLQTQNRPNFSRIPAGRKEGGVKLLDITEQPLGYAAAKKRKRQQELEEQQKKMETQATNNNNNPSSTNNNASSPTSTPATTTPTSVPSTTPDYAAGLTATSVYTQPLTPAPSTASKLLDRPLSPASFTLNPTTSITSTTMTTPTVTTVIKTEPNAIMSPSLHDDELQPPLISIIKTEPSMLQESAVYIKSEPMASIVASTPMTSSIITTTSPFTSLPQNVIIQQQPLSSLPSIVSSSIATPTSIQSPTINKIVINTNKPQISNSINSSTLSSNQISSLMSATTTIPSSTIVKSIPSSLQQIQTSLSGIQTILTSPPTHQQTTNSIIHIPRQTTIKQIPKPQTTKVVTSMQPQHQLHQQQISQPTKIVQIKTQPTIMVSSSNSISHQNIPPLISTQVPSSNKINITNIQNVNIPLNKIQMDATTATKTNIIRLAGPRPMATTTTATTASALIQQQIQQQQQQKMGQIVVQSPGGIKGKTIILANPNQLASKGVIIRSVGPVGNTVYQQIPFSNFINSGPPGLIKTEPGTGGGTTQVLQQNQNNNNQQLPALVPTSQFQTMPSLTPVMITSSNLQQQQQQMPALLTTSGGGGDQTQKTAIVRPVQMTNMQGMNVLPQGLTLIQRPGQQPQLVQVSNQPTLQRTIITQQPQHGDGQQQTTIRPQTIFVPQSQIQQQQMQQQNITNQNPQTNRKGLSLKHKHYVEAQAIFQNANVVTRVEKAVILGFMAGFRENPKPSPENTIVIKLDDSKQKILQENGSYVITSEKSFIKLDYNTGEWKTFKETTILEQHHEEQNPIENSVAIN